MSEPVSIEEGPLSSCQANTGPTGANRCGNRYRWLLPNGKMVCGKHKTAWCFHTKQASAEEVPE